MISPGDLLTASVAAVQGLEPLVDEELNGDNSNVFAYTDAFPTESRILNFIYGQGRPSIMFAYGRLMTGHWGRNEVWRHKLLAYLRPKEQDSGGLALFTMADKLINGIYSDGVSFRETTIHPDCLPPEEVDLKRVIHLDDSYVDYWEFSFILTEIGG